MGTVSHRAWILGKHPSLRPALTAGLMTLLLGLGARSAPAQVRLDDIGDQTDRVERELLRTRDLMERVGSQVKEANIPLANELFQRALGLQVKARERFEASRVVSTPERRLEEALQLTLQARDLTVRAGQVLRDQLSSEEKARRALDRATTFLERLRERPAATDDRRVRVVLEEAERQIDAGERHYRDRNFEVALRLAESALKLLDSVPGGPDNPQTGFDRVQRQIERTRDLLRRAQEHAEGFTPEARRRLERAAALLDDAQHALDEGGVDRARRLDDQCRSLLRSLLDELGARVSEQDVQRALARFDADLERLRRAVGDAPAREVQELIDQAIEERGRAVETASRGEYDRALGQLRVAFEKLSRARRLADPREE